MANSTDFKRDKDTIRNVAKVIGLIVSTFFAVQYGKLHYRQLEQGKILALKRFKGNYDTYMKPEPIFLHLS
jgi:UDP-galactopyranose mutase